MDETPGGLARFVSQAEGLGYRFVAVDPRNTTDLPDNTAVLLIAGPERTYGAPDPGTDRAFRGAWRSGHVAAGSGRTRHLPDGPGSTPCPASWSMPPPPNTAWTARTTPSSATTPKRCCTPPEGASVLKQARALTLADSGGWTVVGRLDSSPAQLEQTGDLRGHRTQSDLGEQVGPVSVGLALQRETTASRSACW